jgi:hypothetical protein
VKRKPLLRNRDGSRWIGTPRSAASSSYSSNERFFTTREPSRRAWLIGLRLQRLLGRSLE